MGAPLNVSKRRFSSIRLAIISTPLMAAPALDPYVKFMLIIPSSFLVPSESPTEETRKSEERENKEKGDEERVESREE